MSATGSPPVPRPRRPARPRRRWRPTLPPAVAGILAVLRLLPRVHQVGTWLFTVAVVASAALPVAVAVVTGLLVGSIPTAVDGGLGSPAGRTALGLLAAVAALMVAQRVTGPLTEALARDL